MLQEPPDRQEHPCRRAQPRTGDRARGAVIKFGYSTDISKKGGTDGRVNTGQRNPKSDGKYKAGSESHLQQLLRTQ